MFQGQDPTFSNTSIPSTFVETSAGMYSNYRSRNPFQREFQGDNSGYSSWEPGNNIMESYQENVPHHFERTQTRRKQNTYRSTDTYNSELFNTMDTCQDMTFMQPFPSLQDIPPMSQPGGPSTGNLGMYEQEILNRQKIDELKSEYNKVQKYCMEIKELNERQLEHETLRRQIEDQKKIIEEEVLSIIKRRKFTSMTYQNPNDSNSIFSSIMPQIEPPYSYNNTQSNNRNRNRKFERNVRRRNRQERSCSLPYALTSSAKEVWKVQNQSQEREDTPANPIIKQKFFEHDENNVTTFEKTVLDPKIEKLFDLKSAVKCIRELMPECIFQATKVEDASPEKYEARITYQGKILATGEGNSSSDAAQRAAENALKDLYCGYFSKCASGQTSSLTRGLLEREHPISLFPWTELASVALHKLFSEWHEEGFKIKYGGDKEQKIFRKKKYRERKEGLILMVRNPNGKLAFSVFNKLKPEGECFEIERQEKDEKTILTLGLDIGGQLFLGQGRSKKQARREAAKLALKVLYGLDIRLCDIILKFTKKKRALKPSTATTGLLTPKSPK